jgi:hypothetical protein
MAKGKSIGAGATMKSKPIKFEKTRDGVIGPRNRQDYGKRKGAGRRKDKDGDYD